MEVVEGSNHFRITGYYGHPERHRRQLSWNLLKHLSRVNSLSWVVIGDFNDILHNREKRGRLVHPLHLLMGFREAVNSCGIWDVVLTGYPFTWSRCRGSPRFVEERLDRVMGNGCWHDLFPTSKLLSLVAPTSDHCPILFDMDLAVVHRKFKSFKFENKWFEERGLTEVVQRSWTGFRDFDVDRRLLATSETLNVWGKHVHYAFINNKKDLESTIKRLQGRRDADSVMGYNTAKKKLVELLIREDIHWKQRAKIFWLKDGDTNTKFFHNMASMRRKKNRISKLRDVNGDWVDSQNREIFSSVRDKIWTKLYSWSSKKLSKAGKKVLIKAATQSIPTYCMSVFSLSSTLLDEIHAELFRQHLIKDRLCNMCAADIETSWHVFMNCRFARACWQLTSVANDVERVALEAESIIDFMLRMISQLEGEKLTEFVMVVWRLWKDQNSKVWNGSSIEAHTTVFYARKYLADWDSASNGSSSSRQLHITEVVHVLHGIDQPRVFLNSMWMVFSSPTRMRWVLVL
ncbi:hypothetical protein ACS0TY_014684 [Phlomoides rotata]